MEYIGLVHRIESVVDEQTGRTTELRIGLGLGTRSFVVARGKDLDGLGSWFAGLRVRILVENGLVVAAESAEGFEPTHKRTREELAKRRRERAEARAVRHGKPRRDGKQVTLDQLRQDLGMRESKRGLKREAEKRERVLRGKGLK